MSPNPKKKKIIQRIRNNDSKLTSVNLSRRNIGDNEAKQVSDALRGNRSVTQIVLADNNISDEGAKSLAKALRVNTTLTVVKKQSDKQ